MRSCCCILMFAAMLVGEKISHGAIFDLPSAVVEGTAATGGPSFVLPIALQPDDVLRAQISGTVDFNASNFANYSADWNAAGVVVRTRSTRLVVGGSDPTFIDQGWLRLSLGNDSLGFFPLLEPNAENGLGAASPLESLLLNRTVGAVFGLSPPAIIPAGAALQYRIVDSPSFDSSGSFIVSLVPEPSFHPGAILLGLSLVGRRRILVASDGAVARR